MFIELILLGVALISIVIAGVFASFFVVTWRRGPSRHEQIRKVQGNLDRVLKGEVETDRGGLRDPRVAKGIVYDKRSRRFIKQGKLTDEYVAALFQK